MTSPARVPTSGSSMPTTIAPETENQCSRGSSLRPICSGARTLRVVWEGEDLDASQADRTPVWFEYKWVQISESFDRTDLPGLRRLFDKLPNEFLRDSLKASDFPAGHPEYLEEAMRQWIRVPGA